jgi:hypothetical protein
MKKLIYLMMAIVAICVTSCHKSEKSDPVSSQSTSQLILDSLAAHVDSISSDYLYFETSFELTNTVDSLDSFSVSTIQSIYQVVDTTTSTPTVFVANYSFESATVSWKVLEGAFWTEDVNLRSKDVKLSPEDAFSVLLKSNVLKPHSRFVVLRCPLGPVTCDAQYIFGNTDSGIVYVNAKTGKVTTTDPAFFPDSVAKQLTPETILLHADTVH